MLKLCFDCTHIGFHPALIQSDQCTVWRMIDNKNAKITLEHALEFSMVFSLFLLILHGLRVTPTIRGCLLEMATLYMAYEHPWWGFGAWSITVLCSPIVCMTKSRLEIIRALLGLPIAILVCVFGKELPEFEFEMYLVCIYTVTAIRLQFTHTLDNERRNSFLQVKDIANLKAENDALRCGVSEAEKSLEGVLCKLSDDEFSEDLSSTWQMLSQLSLRPSADPIEVCIQPNVALLSASGFGCGAGSGSDNASEAAPSTESSFGSVDSETSEKLSGKSEDFGNIFANLLRLHEAIGKHRQKRLARQTDSQSEGGSDGSGSNESSCGLREAKKQRLYAPDETSRGASRSAVASISLPGDDSCTDGGSLSQTGAATSHVNDSSISGEQLVSEVEVLAASVLAASAVSSHKQLPEAVEKTSSHFFCGPSEMGFVL